MSIDKVARAPRYLYDWSAISRVPYSDFLRAQQFERSIRYGIADQSKQLIASNQQLTERGIEVLSDSLDRGFTTLSQDIGGIADAIREGTSDIVGAVNAGTAEIVSTLNWGFSEVLVSLGQMNIGLTELVKLTRTPSQAWACEQFEIARDEFRRRLYPEALQSAQRAIDGLGSNSGIKTEFRFHFLVGTIRLGSYVNCSPEVVNPQLAEQAFLAAARYAEADFPADAGESLICAGRAALLQGAIDKAIEHTRRGLRALPEHAQGTYQLGRALLLKGAFPESKDRLVDAILLNVEHALHASSDPDFISNLEVLNEVLLTAQRRYAELAGHITARYQRAEKTLSGFSFAGVSAKSLDLDCFAKIHETRKLAEASTTSDTLFGYDAAIHGLREGFRLFAIGFEEYRHKFVQNHQIALSKSPHQNEASRVIPPDPNAGKAPILLVSFWAALGSALVWFLVHTVNQWSRPSIVIPETLSCGAIVGVGVAVLLFVQRQFNQSQWESLIAGQASARRALESLKESLEKEMAEVKRMRTPNECSSP